MYNYTSYNEKETQYFGHKRAEMLKYVPLEASLILDVGCGMGHFGCELKKNKKFVVWGVEPNKEAADIACSKLDHVINSPFDGRIELSNMRFDCIIFNDVLEHMPYPHETIEIAKKYLKPAGVIVSSIPNVFYYWSFMQNVFNQDWRYEDAGIMDKTHLRFFSSKSIKRMFVESGGKIITHEGINAYYSRKFKLFNYLTFFKFNDWQFQQFATVVKYQ